MIGRQEGMTIVEVMIAGLILVLGSLALLALVDTTARSTYRAEQGQVVSDRLQQEMEEIKQLPYGEIALTGLPSDTSNTKIPSWRMVGTSFATNQNGTGVQPLVYNGSTLYSGGSVTDGAISPAPEPFESGDVKGTIYRFVTWEDDPTCPASQCPGTQDLKRLIVSILLDSSASGGTRSYQELQSQVADPELLPVDDENPIPPGDDDAQPWTFWLTDTTCNNATRQPIVGDHLTHNTRGRCVDGLKNGNSNGAPDLMVTEAPTFNPEAPIFDYATDVEPTLNPESDRGLQLVRDSLDGCPSYALDVLLAPDGLGQSDRFQKVHKWLSQPIPSGFDIQLNGEGTLNLWTQTVNGAVHPGRICAWLFVRKNNVLGVPTDTPAVNQDPALLNQTYFSYQQSQWPTEWTEIHIPLDFVLNTQLLPGSRLGVAFSVERSGTVGAEGLQFMYDEPSFDSRLEVKTSANLPTF